MSGFGQLLMKDQGFLGKMGMQSYIDTIYPKTQPQAQQMPVLRDYGAEQDARASAEKTRRASGLAMGAGSTMLTGGMGLVETATTKRKQLFGE